MLRAEHVDHGPLAGIAVLQIHLELPAIVEVHPHRVLSTRAVLLERRAPDILAECGLAGVRVKIVHKVIFVSRLACAVVSRKAWRSSTCDHRDMRGGVEGVHPNRRTFLGGRFRQVAAESASVQRGVGCAFLRPATHTEQRREP